ncbi:MAG: Maf family protein [Candidatus Melainabacteria bacterium]|nr:Maf family protein [Candidatus Melainabacteria bacterium]
MMQPPATFYQWTLPPLVLASASPRRRELLTALGLSFEVLPADLDEALLLSQNPHATTPQAQVECLAKAKAQAVQRQYPQQSQQALVLAADTMVVLEGQGLGKPVDEADACAMLRGLQGRRHSVWSAVALAYGQAPCRCNSRETRVWMRCLTDRQIERYVATGEPMDKAGSYAIQGQGSLLIERIEGCYYNVVGLSLPLLAEMLEAMGYAAG